MEVKERRGERGIDALHCSIMKRHTRCLVDGEREKMPFSFERDIVEERVSEANCISNAAQNAALACAFNVRDS